MKAIKNRYGDLHWSLDQTIIKKRQHLPCAIYYCIEGYKNYKEELVWQKKIQNVLIKRRYMYD